MKKFLLILLLLLSTTAFFAPKTILPGATQTQSYLPLLKGKRVGVFANATSRIGQQHLIDVLLKHHIHVVKIFAPEHGFRGDVDERVSNSVDEKTGIPIVSLYGKKLSPTAEDLQDVDVLVFDIQDVGVRFYTYISSLQKLMETAIKNNKPLIILDRPNPNGFYVDGPVLEPQFKSFTGMQPIPLVYGMTMGEYAKMLVGENWLTLPAGKKAQNLKLTIIPCVHYTHKSLYIPPVKPSPNLPDIQSIYLYPSMGLMEATVMSVGRGTDKPFHEFGHPLLRTHFSFIPTPKTFAKSPLYENQVCYGWKISGNQKTILKKINNKLQIKFLMQAYRAYPEKTNFFEGFSAAAGNNTLEELIKAGASEKEIRKSWEPQLSEFKQIRQRYLIYQ